MRSFSSLTRALRMFAMSVFMLNVLAVPALAIETDTDSDHIYDEDETLYGFDLNNPDENGNGVIDGEDDYEGDGLITQSELYLYGTNPTSLDTDSDGRGDYNEIFVAPTSDPLDADSDDDGLGDYAEFATYGTDPELPDTDGDGLGDYYEEITLTDAGFTVSGNDFDSDDDGLSDGAEDFDSDGLTNNEEQNTYFTDPIVADTDEDGFSDGTEALNGTDPLIFEAADLDITDISMDPVTGMISYTATNLGNLDVDYTIDLGYTGVYLNYGEADETMAYYDWNTEMGAGSWTGSFFTAGGSEVIDSGVGLTSGEHSVMVCIDRAAMHGETAYGFDNCEIETFQVGPDLTVTDISFEEFVGFPGQFYVYVDLANLGDIDADATVPGTIVSTLNGVSIQTYNWSAIEPSLQGFLVANGSTLDAESLGERPSLVEGDVIEVCVDTSDLVNELDESNNCLSVTYTDDAEPDLVIDSVTLNSDTSVSFVTRNGGTDEVDSSLFPYLNFYYDFYNSDLSTSASDSYLMDDHGTDYRSIDGVTTVNSGAAAEAFPTCTLYVLAVVDGTGEVTELDDMNNEYRTTLDLCPEALTVEAGVDEGIGLGNMYNLAAYAEGATSLTSATVDWGDGSSLETLTQTVDGARINLTASHLYDHRETFTVTVCANDGIETVCDALSLSITGSSSGDSSGSSSSSSSGSSSSGTSDSSSTGGSSSGSSSSSSSDSDSSSDEEVDLTEEDQDVTLSEDEDVADCSAMMFEDVSEDDTFYTAVCELWAEDILHGKTANFFDSEDEIRRDEASKIFTRWFGYVTEAYGETPEATEGTYMDVEVADPLAYYIEVADEQRIVRADVDTFEDEDGETVSEAYFMPHDALTAQEIADALEVILGDNEAGEALDEEGYESSDTMTRGSFVEFLYGLSR